MGNIRGLLGLVLAVGLLAGCGGRLMDDTEVTDAEMVETAPPEAATESTDPAEPELPEPDVSPRPAREKKVRKPPAPSLQSRVPDVEVPELKLPPVFDGPVLGADISWPQCPKGMGIPEKRTLGMPMPLPEAKYVVIGLTNGPAFTPNPCLADQVRWVEKRRLMASAYAVPSYPDSETIARYGRKGPFDASTEAGRLSNVGYQQALYNLGNLEAAGLKTPLVWIDVEPVPSFEWSTDRAANAAVITGVARGYTDNGYQIGVYSTPALYEGVVGDLRFGIPEWRAAGQTSQAEALSRCGKDWSIQGGQAVIGQWVQYSRDLNITCPGAEREMFRYFHQY